MAARPGFRQKHLPVRIDADNGNLLSGGRYLFDTVENAEKYKSWAENDFVLDGIKFFERPVFFDPVCYVWRVVGAQNRADFTSHALHPLRLVEHCPKRRRCFKRAQTRIVRMLVIDRLQPAGNRDESCQLLRFILEQPHTRHATFLCLPGNPAPGLYQVVFVSWR